MISRPFVAIGAAETPRWLLPTREPSIGIALAGWRPQRWTSRLAWNLVKLAARHGGLDMLPGTRRMKLEWIGSIDWQRFGWTRPTPPIPVLHMGSAGPFRKAVLHLVDAETQRCELIVKVPFTEAASLAIVQEANVLEKLEADAVPRTPRLIFVDRRRGLSAQTVLPGSPDGRTLNSAHWSALRQLQLTGESTTLAERAAQLQALLATAPPEAESLVLHTALTQSADPAPLAACWQHGDFAPWNIKQQADGNLALFDWEEGQRGGLPLHDAYHYVHVQRYLFHRRARPIFRELREPAAKMGLDLKLCRKLELAYLTSVYLRQLQRGNRAFCGYLVSVLRMAVRT